MMDPFRRNSKQSMHMHVAYLILIRYEITIIETFSLKHDRIFGKTRYPIFVIFLCKSGTNSKDLLHSR
jgi:hypothetical protein